MLDLIGKVMLILGVLGSGFIIFYVVSYHFSLCLGIILGAVVPLIILMILGKRRGGWQEKAYNAPGAGPNNP